MTSTLGKSTISGTKLIGYAVAGGLLLLAGDIVPDLAEGTAGLIFLVALLNFSGQLTVLSNFLKSTLGG